MKLIKFIFEKNYFLFNICIFILIPIAWPVVTDILQSHYYNLEYQISLRGLTKNILLFGLNFITSYVFWFVYPVTSLIRQWSIERSNELNFRYWLEQVLISVVIGSLYFELMFFSLLHLKLMSGDSNFVFLLPLVFAPLSLIESLILAIFCIYVKKLKSN